MFTLHNGDCLPFMRSLPDKAFDLIITDPPYGINADIAQNKNAGNKGGTRGGYYKKYHETSWDNSIPSKEVFAEMFRVSKNQIIFGGNYFTEYLPPSRCWIVWDKVVRAHFPDGEMAWGSFDKGLKIFRYSRADAYINSIKVKEHPTQKPVNLFNWIIQNYSNENEKIFDPFMGSGTTGVSCVAMGRVFTGCEIDKKYFEVAKKRIKLAAQSPSFLTPSNNRLQPTAFGVGTQAEFPLLGGTQADESPATHGGG